MKKIIYATAIACLMFTAASAQGNNVSFSQNSDGKTTKSTIEIDNNGSRLKVEYTGNITLNDSETAIASISSGGVLKYSKNGSRLVAESKDGGIAYQLNDNGEELSQQSEKGIKFIATVVKELISLGFDAQHHVDRIYQRGGASAVIAEIGNLSSDYVKQLYLQELFKIGKLSTAEMNEVAKSVADMHGNYEKGQLLQKFAKAYLSNPLTIQAYFDAAGTIGGDYEKSQVLKAALVEHPSNTAMEQLLKVATTIGGNYEKGQVLQTALTEQPNNTALGLLLTATATIGGDYEKSEVLKKASRAHGLNEENCNKLLNAADGIHGAYEKAGVLTAVIDNDTLSNNSFNLLLQVAEHISSAYEKSGVLKALAAVHAWSTDEWVGLINATASVNAAYEKSNTLVTIAGKIPADAKIREAYMTTAKTIGSTYDYDQAVNAAK